MAVDARRPPVAALGLARLASREFGAPSRAPSPPRVPGLRPPADAVRRTRLARDVLHDRHGALAHERDGLRVGAHAVARRAGSGLEALTKASLDG
jgi:hypothetical protein